VSEPVVEAAKAYAASIEDEGRIRATFAETMILMLCDHVRNELSKEQVHAYLAFEKDGMRQKACEIVCAVKEELNNASTAARTKLLLERRAAKRISKRSVFGAAAAGAIESAAEAAGEAATAKNPKDIENRLVESAVLDIVADKPVFRGVEHLLNGALRHVIDCQGCQGKGNYSALCMYKGSRKATKCRYKGIEYTGPDPHTAFLAIGAFVKPAETEKAASADMFASMFLQIKMFFEGAIQGQAKGASDSLADMRAAFTDEQKQRGASAKKRAHEASYAHTVLFKAGVAFAPSDGA
jgi:hypothetical protein